MTVWLFILAVVVMASLWMRSASRKRQDWLRALNLPGKWELDPPPAANGGTPETKSLTLSGELAGGTYVAREGDAIHRGKWRLRGHSLGLEPTEGRADAPAQYDLRLFEKGKIGLDGPGREREVYVKRDSNVIPLRVRK